MKSQMQKDSGLWHNLLPAERSDYALRVTSEIQSCQKLKPWDVLDSSQWIGVVFPEHKTPFLLEIQFDESLYPVLRLYSPRGTYLPEVIRHDWLVLKGFPMCDLADFVQVRFVPFNVLSQKDRDFAEEWDIWISPKSEFCPEFSVWRIGAVHSVVNAQDMRRISVGMGIASDLAQILRNLPKQHPSLWIFDEKEILLRYPVFRWNSRNEDWEAKEENFESQLENPPVIAAFSEARLKKWEDKKAEHSGVFTIFEHVLSEPTKKSFSRVLGIASWENFTLKGLDYSSGEVDIAKALSDIIYQTFYGVHPQKLFIPEVWIPILAPLCLQLRIEIGQMDEHQKLLYSEFHHKIQNSAYYIEE